MLENGLGKTMQLKSNGLEIFDIAKMVFAFFVVCIHTGTGLSATGIDLYFMQGLFRVAVPCFFFLAGYFLFGKIPSGRIKDSKSNETIKRYFFRIVSMYVIWSLFYLAAVQIPGWLKNGFSLRDFLIYIEYATVRGDSYLHLWYLSSLYTGVALVWLARKWFNSKTTLVISFVFFVLGLLLNPYYFLAKPVVEGIPVVNWIMYNLFNRFIGGPRCGLFFGFVFVALGAYFAEQKKVLSRGISLAGLLVSFALSMLEITVINNNWVWDSGVYGALQLSHIPLVIFLFSFLFSFRNVKIGYAKEMRTISTVVYLIHPAVICLVDMIPVYGQLKSYPFVAGIIVYLLSILVSVIWIKLEKTKVFSFLKKVR